MNDNHMCPPLSHVDTHPSTYSSSFSEESQDGSGLSSSLLILLQDAAKRLLLQPQRNILSGGVNTHDNLTASKVTTPNSKQQQLLRVCATQLTKCELRTNNERGLLLLQLITKGLELTVYGVPQRQCHRSTFFII